MEARRKITTVMKETVSGFNSHFDGLLTFSGYDETIYPVDFRQAGHIVDDEMHMIMVKSLPAGCRLTAIFDSCHSGSALDLPYLYSTQVGDSQINIFHSAFS